MLKTLGKHIKGVMGASILTPVFMIGEVIMEMLIPLLMASIINDGVEAGNMQHIYLIGGLMVAAALVSLAFGIGGGVFGAKASTGFARNLRKAMYERIQTFSFANIDKFSTAGLVTRLTTDVTNIQNAYQMILRMCMRAPVSLVCAMVVSFMISPRLASIYLVAVLMLGCVLGLIVTCAMKYFSQAFPKYDALNESVQENVSAIRVVKAYVREDYENEKFKKASGGIYKIFCKAEGIVAWNGPVMNLTVYSCIILISWIGARLIVQGSLETGDLMALLTYCMTILMNLMMLSMIFVMITMSAASARRICEVLTENPDLANPPSPVMEVADGSIRFDHVSFRYKKDADSPVLKDINLEIRSGETIGIIGGTGSAKSTLVNLISRLYDVTEGQLLVGGVDVRSYDMEILRNQVAVVLQNNVLFSGTILENLRWGDLDASEEECVHACQLACADEFIRKMPEGYNTYIEQGGTNVSGGQKQRLCIARALLKKPKILILDDSTSAVDTATDARIRRAFAQEIPGTTKLIIAQRISSVEHADRIIVMHEGEIDGFGTHDQLLASNEIYRDVYESQTHGNGDFDENTEDNSGVKGGM
ncbi:MAG: ABC transporter ATP-binding protein/permease [Acetatifactor sp.]|nr:ABC transporter ATP-binding protein/permease [Acetatifactor sp.]